MVQLGYNTNGFAHHRLVDAIAIIGQLGYRCVALTLDHCALDPWNPDLPNELSTVKHQLAANGLSCVIETGARFLLDPWKKHEPTLLSNGLENRARRLDFLKRAVDIACALDANVVSFWSGAKPLQADYEIIWQRLVDGCRDLANYAVNKHIILGFEPEPGMFVETLTDYERLRDDVGSSSFRLTLDVGHVLISESISIADCFHRYREDIVNVHIEDMKKGRHAHLFFGEGEIDFPSVFQALRDSQYSGPVCVELSRHSHRAVETARAAKRFLLYV